MENDRDALGNTGDSEYDLLRSEAAKFAADLMARSKSRGGIGIGGLLAPPILLPLRYDGDGDGEVVRGLVVGQ